MKVYVENKYIPDKCSKCNFIGHYEDGIYKRNPHCCCELYWDLHQDEIRVDKNIRDERCPLQSLADYTKQVRKEVIENLKQEIIYYQVGLLGIDGKSHKNTLGISKEILESYFEKILDQKQGDKK